MTKAGTAGAASSRRLSTILLAGAAALAVPAGALAAAPALAAILAPQRVESLEAAASDLRPPASDTIAVPPAREAASVTAAAEGEGPGSGAPLPGLDAPASGPAPAGIPSSALPGIAEIGPVASAPTGPAGSAPTGSARAQARVAELEARFAGLANKGEAIGAAISARIQARDGAGVAPAPAGDLWSGTGSAGASTQGWALPVTGAITDGYGARPDAPVPGVSQFHGATDLAAACGTPVYAAAAGTVTTAGRVGTYGNWILLDHGTGVQTGYAHNTSLLVSVGDRVVAGQQIATVGSTGASTGCHLHFEARVNETKVDPVPFMAARGVALG